MKKITTALLFVFLTLCLITSCQNNQQLAKKLDKEYSETFENSKKEFKTLTEKKSFNLQVFIKTCDSLSSKAEKKVLPEPEFPKIKTCLNLAESHLGLMKDKMEEVKKYGVRKKTFSKFKSKINELSPSEVKSNYEIYAKDIKKIIDELKAVDAATTLNISQIENFSKSVKHLLK